MNEVIAKSFSMRTSEKILFLFTFAVIITGVIISHVDLEYYQAVYTREDGFLEWATVIALFLGMGTCIYRVKILRKFREPLFIIGLLVMAFVFLFGLGEEISWGQRIFNWKTPRWFCIHNTQCETNLHNLKFGETKINKLIFGLFLGICIAFYFLILPVLYSKFEKIKNLVNRFAIPIPKPTHIIAYLTLFFLAQSIPGHKKGEILEFGGCWIFYIMILAPRNRDYFSRKSFER